MKTLKYALKNEWYIFILLLLPFIAIPFIWHQLPAKMAIHWDLHGNVNGTSSKAFAVLFEPVLNVFLYFLFLYLPEIDPKRRITINQKPMPVLRLSFVLLISCSYAWSTLKALHYTVPPVNWVLPGVAILLAVVGNYLRTVQPNYFIGIRVPWTLEDPENWRQTHRMASYLWVAGGILLLVMFPFLNTQLYFNFFMTVVIIIALIPCIYSFYLYKTKS